MSRVEISYDNYEKEYGELIRTKTNFAVEEVYEYYHNNIFPILPLIARYRSGDSELYATTDQIKAGFYLADKMFKICKKTFQGLKSAMNGKAIRLDMLVQGTLINELYENPSAKYVELGLKRFDEGYNPKGENTTIELPKTLTVEYKNVQKSDEELKDYEKTE